MNSPLSPPSGSLLHTRLAGLAAVLLLFAAGDAAAQTIYRHVDKNGKVSFSDQASPAGTAPATVVRPGIATPPNSDLPYELRQVVQRYPVTLYSGSNCEPCDAGRSLLIARGVPFDERGVKSSADVEALQRLSSQASLPLLAIGSQQLKGFSDAVWSQYLDAAGYPKSNNLPAGYRNPPARPLVAAQQQAATQTAAPPQPLQLPLPPPDDAPSPSNPAGIRF
jgi:hypothetical protein